MNTIYLANAIQVTLFVNELSGQLSDGFYENSRPQDHWKVPCAADVKVDAANPRLTFVPSRSYNFANNELIAAVGDRMLQYARARIKYPQATDEAIGLLSNGEWMFGGDWFYVGEGASHAANLATLGIANATDLKRVNLELRSGVNYKYLDLRKDLKEISAVFRKARS